MNIVARMDPSKLTQIASSVHSEDMKYAHDLAVLAWSICRNLQCSRVFVGNEDTYFPEIETPNRVVDEELMCTILKCFAKLLVQ